MAKFDFTYMYMYTCSGTFDFNILDRGETNEEFRAESSEFIGFRWPTFNTDNVVIFRFRMHCTLVPEQVGPGSSSFFHLPVRTVLRTTPLLPAVSTAGAL